ncbi:MAG: hypothetical protein IKE52_02470 [Mogibacterium sp.]|nr:hypothetical protein [Mogibacterium sp.]
MKISQKDWKNYIAKLRRVNSKAADMVADYARTHDISTREGVNALIDFSYAVATKYGEGAAALTCQMYDAVATASKARVPAAEPAATATIGETAKAVRGKLFDTADPKAIGGAVGRLVKMAGVDTTMQNALRDGAEWAWVPSGDTCAYCLMLASNGWQKASQKAIKGGHAEHIHNNCDCTYQIRFDSSLEIEGYDPDKLYDEYMSAGNSPRERLNALRRQQYAVNKDQINAQKRAAYARRVGSMRSGALKGAYNDENDPFFLKREKAGEDIYTEIRNRKREYEIESVAQNSGFSTKEIEIVFEHIFEKEHLFEDGSIKKFDSDYYMAQSWLRLREGKSIQKHDFVMLRHELEEAKIMSKNLEISYEKAHNIAEEKWSYKKALMEYLKNHDA